MDVQRVNFVSIYGLRSAHKEAYPLSTQKSLFLCDAELVGMRAPSETATADAVAFKHVELPLVWTAIGDA